MEIKKKRYLHLTISENQEKVLKERAEELGLNVASYIRMLFMKESKEKFLG